MDYKEKYEEALERARENYELKKTMGLLATADTIEAIFPELRESYDERIRKEIIDIVEAYRANCVYEGTHRFDDCLAYLKKQKELDKMIVVSHEVWDNAISDAFENGKKEGEKQKEQKPVENPFDANETMKMKDRIDEGFTKMMMQEQKPADGKYYSSPDCGTTAGYTSDESECNNDYRVGKTFSGLIPCWVNAPSELQPAHKYHGKNIVAMHDNIGGFRCVCIDDEKPTTFHLPENTLLVEGWRKEQKPSIVEKLREISTPANEDWFEIQKRWEKEDEQKPAEWKPQPESLEALMYAIEGKWEMIKPTSYLSRRLEDLYEGLVNTYNVDETFLAELPKTAYTAKDIEELRALKDKIEASMDEKPAEWSDEDNIGWDEAFACVTRAEKAAKNEEELQNAVTAEKWLKEIKFNYCVHPVKREWSEEDEKIFERFLGWLQGTMGEKTYSSWLKSVRERFNLQPKQEWSEEDENCLSTVIWCFEKFAEGRATVCIQPGDAKAYLKVIKNWKPDNLKSLRPQPHWEPSGSRISEFKMKLNEFAEAYNLAATDCESDEYKSCDGNLQILINKYFAELLDLARTELFKHDLAIKFMSYLDENRPEGKMCLSNSECEEIEKAFLVGDWEKIKGYFHKYQWKPSEEQMEALRVTIDFMPDTFKPRCTLITLQNCLEKLI